MTSFVQDSLTSPGQVESGEFSFSVDSSLLFQLGEQLVAKPSIALAELVKNAYDADATTVTVTMEHISSPGGTMLVEDDGHGMTFETVRDAWMRIATAAKQDFPRSQRYHRPLTGAKGIGRFAARRLGSALTLESVAARDDNTKERVVATFDWTHNFPRGVDLTTVPVAYTRQAVSNETPTGVSLLIGDMRDAWTAEEIATLKRDLLSLQSPFPDLVPSSGTDTQGNTIDPGFTFTLVVEGTPEWEALSSELGDEFLSAAWARIEGWVDEQGNAHYEYTGLRTDDHDSLVDTENRYPGLGHVRFRVYFMVYDSKYFSGTSFRVHDAQQKGRSEGGVRIYLDGFRVFPYGESRDDWLQLDEYASRNIDMAGAITPSSTVLAFRSSIPRRPFLLIPKNYQLFGVVAISQTEQSTIGINISRERLLETPTVISLRRFVQNGIYWMTLKYAAHVAKERERKNPSTRSVPDIIDEAKATLTRDMRLQEDDRQALIATLDEAAAQSRVEQQERITEIAMLRVLASAGTTLELMNHQLQALITGILLAERNLLSLESTIPPEIQPRYHAIESQISRWRGLIEQQVSQLGFLLGPDSRQRRRRHVLHEMVENVRGPMSYYMDEYGVSFENTVPPDLRTPPMYQAELYAVLINLLSNALKAVHGQPARRVAVHAKRTGHELRLSMLDTGIGLAEARWESSFSPFVTTSVPNPVLGVGTGLGLKVVRDIIQTYGGMVHFVEAPPSWHTCIEITLPERGTSDGI